LNEAAIYTARRGETIIQNQDILDSLEKLIVGLIRKVDTRSDEARRRVAIHEIGHAFLCSLYNDYFDLKKVTIQSTYNGAGGYTLFNERQNITESGLYTKDMYKKQLIIAMGGKAAENIYYGNSHISVGAIQDLKQANGLAEQMIGNYGMGETLEPFYNKNLDPMSVKSGDSYSEKTKVLIDEESINLVNDALNTAKKILLENKDKLDILVDKLLEKTTLYNEEFDEILNNEDDCECSIM
jgi:cell division protease FtsH